MFIRVCYGQGMFGVCFMFLFSFCVCRLSKVARRSSGVHLFVLITNLVCVGVTLLRGAPVYFLRSFKEVRTVSKLFRVTQFSG